MLVGMGRSGRDARLVLLAERQGGAFSREQAIRQGFPSTTIGRRLASGAWQALHPGVYAVAGTTTSRTTMLWAAVLAAGRDAAVTHESAALLHGAERLPLSPLTLTARHGSHHRIAGAMVHQIDDLVPWHRTRRDGLPVSTPARCIVELGATSPLPLVGRAMDDLVRLKRTSYADVSVVLAQLSRPGKPGVAAVARLLDERGDGYVPSQTELEDGLFGAIAAGGLPPPLRQIPLPGRGPIRGIADGGYPDAKIVLEADGRRWHQRVESARRDRERDAQVVRAGWVPLRFLHEQIVGDPAGVCAAVAETRATRLRQLGLAA
jgi:hypothetical protein